MSEAALAIGRKHFRFGALMADQRIDVARMGRAGERVGFGKFVGLGLFHASGCALTARRRIEPRLDRRPDGGGDLVFASVGVDDDAAPGLGGGDVEERPPKGFVKGQPLRFEPVGRPLPAFVRPRA